MRGQAAVLGARTRRTLRGAVMPYADPITRGIEGRRRNRAWMERHRKCVGLQPWLAGAPPFTPHLPGGWLSVDFDPRPTWPLELRHTRALHGALTTMQDRPHRRYPAWSLRPWLSGWAVYFAALSDAQAWAGKTLNGALWDRPTAFRFGPLVRVRAPESGRRGHSRVRVDIITPIVTRSTGGTNPCTCPTKDTLTGALAGELLYRISPTHSDETPADDVWSAWVKPRVRIEIVERHTEPAHVPLGGKYGSVAGWQGYVILDVNAVALWLLQACERGPGFGGRVAFGFGRIRVTPC